MFGRGFFIGLVPINPIQLAIIAIIALILMFKTNLGFLYSILGAYLIQAVTVILAFRAIGL